MIDATILCWSVWCDVCARRVCVGVVAVVGVDDGGGRAGCAWARVSGVGGWGCGGGGGIRGVVVVSVSGGVGW